MNSLKFYCFLSILTMGSAHINGQTEKYKSTSTLSYSIQKVNVDSLVGKNQFALEIKIPKQQFDTPEVVGMNLKDSKDSLIFEYVAELDLISGAKVDSTGTFSVDHDFFVFHVRGVSPKRYKTGLFVLLREGDSYFIKTEEDYSNEKGGKP